MFWMILLCDAVFVLIYVLYVVVIIILIIRFFIYMQLQGQHPHQWAPFQVAGLLHTWQISHQISRYVYHEGQATQVAHWTWWWQWFVAWHCRSVRSLPCLLAADIGGLALSMAKSHWHGALGYAHKSCTGGHVSWKKDGGKRELVAAPWTCCGLKITVTGCWEHVS